MAKRAGVSRMTIYRRWPDMTGLLADLLVREWGALVATELRAEPAGTARPDRAIADGGGPLHRAAVRDNPLFRKIVEVDPELLLPYLLPAPRPEPGPGARRSSADAVTAAQAQPDDPCAPATRRTWPAGSCSTLHGFLFSAGTMTGDATAADRPRSTASWPA